MTLSSQNFNTILATIGFNQTSLSALKQNLLGNITDVQNGKLIDITNITAIAHLTRLANKTYLLPNCNNNITLDSWVPNTASNIISCASGI